MKESVPAVKLGQGSFEKVWPPKQLVSEPADTYHAKAKEHLSSHALADFRKCPRLFRRKRLGLIPDRDSSAYMLGRASHTLVLEGRKRFEAEFAVGGPINEKTGLPYGDKTKAFAEWAAEQGKPVISESDAALIEQMAISVKKHDVASELLSDGVAEAVLRCEMEGHQCQGRFDWLNPRDGIVDFKTCRDIDSFERDAIEYGYIHQMAFYRALLFLGTDCFLPVHLIAAEKKEPYRVGVWKIDEYAMHCATMDNFHAMHELERCERNDTWPTRFETARTLQFTA